LLAVIRLIKLFEDMEAAWNAQDADSYAQKRIGN
jgi:hypothetical protein